ncbi:hypothetical protein PGT21_036051 [Puccinia graminis f. sp. tritici]|uniref:RNase H type-1 domain-containing protein n=1 Tax=Puccinia graminis f. sp. tritici TaxID=56615 RepID=A0A5B0Q042_PUCGR|nr:hypothetical protein PGT21_036051 [Puccinia graminis f. sp. tritici]
MSASPSTHPSPIHNILDKHLISNYNLSSIETIYPHIIDPWEDFSIPISNLKTKKEEIKSKVQLQINNLKSKSEHLIFTDGSNIPEIGSASAALLDNTTEFSCRISDSQKSSAFEAEVQAISIGLEIFINKFLNSPSNVSSNIAPINIFCDSQSTLFSIANPPLPKSYQFTFLNIFKKLKIISKLCHIPIALFWCPAHVGIPENETVDKLAKAATLSSHPHHLQNQIQSLSNTQQLARSFFKFNKTKKSIIRNKIRLSFPPLKIFEQLDQLERSTGSIIYQLRGLDDGSTSRQRRLAAADKPSSTGFVCGTIG